MGKGKWEDVGYAQRDIHLYEAKPMRDYGVVLVSRAVGQAFLTPNMENMTIPFHLNKFQKSAFPFGKADSRNVVGNGSKLWVVNKALMESGHSRYSQYRPLSAFTPDPDVRQ